MAKNNTVNIDIRAHNKTGAAFSKLRQNMGGLSKQMGGFKALFAGAFAGASLIGLKRMITSTADAGDQLQKLSIRLGASTEALSQYRHVAELSGVSFDSFTNSLKKLQKSSSDAAVGLSTPKRAFEELGISVENFQALKPTEQFEVLSDAILKIENPAKRTQIAMDLMGRSGSDMLTIMLQGSDGIKKMREEADALGLTLTRTEADALANYNDSMSRLGTQFTGLAQVITVAVAPTLEAFAKYIGEVLPRVIENFARGWKRLRNFFVEGTVIILDNIRKVAESLGNLPDLLGGDTFKGWAASIKAQEIALIEMRLEFEKISVETIPAFKVGMSDASEASLRNAAAMRKTTEEAKNLAAAQKELNKRAKKVKNQTRTKNDDLNDLKELYDADLITFEQYQARKDQIEGKYKKKSKATAKDVKENWADTWTDAGDMLGNFVENGKVDLDSFKNFAIQTALDIGKSFAKDLFGGGGGGGFNIGSLFGSFFGGGGASAQVAGDLAGNSQFFTPFANGGMHRGGLRLVGERGPELEATGPSRIFNAQQTKNMLSGGGGGTVINIDARGAEIGVEEKIRAVLASEKPRIIQDAVTASEQHITNLADSGGSFARTMGRR